MGKHSAPGDGPSQPRGPHTANSSPDQQTPIPTETRRSRLNNSRAETQSQASTTSKPTADKTNKHLGPHIKDWTLGQRLLAGFLLIGFILSAVSTVALWPSNTPARVDKSFQETSSLPQNIADGTVAVTTEAACGSPSVGRTFDDTPREPTTSTGTCTRAIVDITSGPDKEKRTLIETSHKPGDPDLREGDKIRMTRHATDDGSMGYAFNDYQRQVPVIAWLIITAIAMVAIGSWRGTRSLVGLVITMVIIGAFMLPALLRGGDPLLLAVTSCALIMFVVIYLVHGISWKSSSALAGTIIALGLAAVMAGWGIDGTRLRGLGEEDNLLVQLYLPDVTVHGLMLAGFIVGAIGALNDATVAQASTVNELAIIDRKASPWRLFTGGMQVGRDHIASMLYTLILSYAGAALPMLLLITASERPLGQVLTSDLIATEIVRSAVGAIALALAVPITTIIAAITVKPDSDARSAGGHGHGHVHVHHH
ncbi:YibE/F family protein [uncultured Corynebacterium sp.]|uniref:YibE/F family protein n=1 Tax=uncultured Corynebacterium sp. TaxID=159447 RepID=UPI0025D1A026|nr:YibE/F family protein [uncultured Corynebacterium sp.]